MFTSRRSPFSSERGTTKSWFAGITAAALLVGTVALPAMAEDTAAPEVAPISEAPTVETPAEEAPAAEAPAEEAPAEEAPAEEAPAEEAILGDGGVEDEVVSDGSDSSDAAAQAPESAAADVPAPGDATANPAGSDKKSAKTSVATASALAEQLAFVAPGNNLQFTLEGCRNNGTITLPNADGKYICPDAAYTTGNLGKGWNELDLVPHRLTITNSGATSTFNVVIAADYKLGSKVGYDVISVPESGNPGTCTVDDATGGLTGAEATGVTGGVDTVKYRIITVTAEKGTCQINWVNRLALGAAQYSGSSLQSYMFESEDFQTGKRTVSIPVKEIKPQELSKTMTAKQGQDFNWTIAKSATPASLSFGDTCTLTGTNRSQDVTITVSWTRTAVLPSGQIAIETKVTATNPASRTITVSVSDKWYEGATASGTPIREFNGSAKDVAGASSETWTFSDVLSSTATTFNDVATATYTDKATGVAVPGNTQATASTSVSASGTVTDASATISDIESITGAGFSYKVNSVSSTGTAPTSTSWNGYTVGTTTTNPVTWSGTIAPAGTGAASGTIVFSKTVLAAEATTTTNGKLSDTATLTPSTNKVDQTDNASINLSAAKKVDLTVTKYTPTVFTDSNPSATFTFQVWSGTTKAAEQTMTVTKDTLVVNGEHKSSITFNDLAPGTYTVREVPLKGWAPQPDKTVDLAAEDVVCSASVEFRNQDIRDLTVSKSATPSFTRTYTWDVEKSVKEPYYAFPAGAGPAEPTYTIEVKRSQADSAFAVAGTITVNNPNAIPVPLTGVSDSLPNATCTVTGGPTVENPANVPANGSLNYAYSCALSGATATTAGTNTANITWDDEWTYNNIVYTTNGSQASGTAAFDFAKVTPTLVNPSVWLDDPNAPDAAGFPVKVTAPGTYTYKSSYPGVPGKCTTYPNTASIYATSDTTTKPIDSASASVKVCVGKDLTVSKTAEGSYGRTYLWKISKDANATKVNIADGGSYTFKYTVVAEQTGISDKGWTVDGKITVTNPNDWQDITADVTDTISNGGACTVTGGTAVKIAAGESVELAYSCTYASQPTSYSGTNTAKADWSADKAAVTPKTSATGTAPFTMTQSAGVNQTIHVTDTYAGDLGTVLAADTTPYAKSTFTYDRTGKGVAGTCTTYDNTATITETGQSASKDVTLCVGKDLTVSKTAAGSYNREYLWAIDKLVNGQKSASILSDAATEKFDYSVTAYQTGFVDSGWTLNGTITVNNPNDWQAITLTGLTDVVDNGGICTVAAGPYVIPKSGSKDVAYSCTFAKEPTSYSGTNTATATWDKDAAATPSGSASGSKGFTLTQATANDKNKQVTVVDTLKGTLGALTATDAPEFTSAVYKYDLEFESPAEGECVAYPNTASVLPALGDPSEEENALARVALLEEPAPLATSSASAEVCTGTLDKSANPTEGTAVGPGTVITYKIVVTNPSGEKVTSQTLLDTVPTGVVVDEASITPSGVWNATARTITWTFDLPAAGDGGPGSATFTYKAAVSAAVGAGPVVNIAEWVQRKLTDSTRHPVIGIPGLDKNSTIADGGSTVEPGDLINYTVSVSNVGGLPITGPVVDTLPVGLTAVASTVTGGGVVSNNGQTITWQVVNLAPGSTLTFTYQAGVGEGVVDGQSLVNVATFQGLQDSTTTPVELPPVSPIEDEEVVESEEIADTGAGNTGTLVSTALLAMLAGGLMITFDRRRRRGER